MKPHAGYHSCLVPIFPSLGLTVEALSCEYMVQRSQQQHVVKTACLQPLRLPMSAVLTDLPAAQLTSKTSPLTAGGGVSLALTPTPCPCQPAPHIPLDPTCV